MSKYISAYPSKYHIPTYLFTILSCSVKTVWLSYSSIMFSFPLKHISSSLVSVSLIHEYIYAVPDFKALIIPLSLTEAIEESEVLYV